MCVCVKERGGKKKIFLKEEKNIIKEKKVIKKRPVKDELREGVRGECFLWRKKRPYIYIYIYIYRGRNSRLEKSDKMWKINGKVKKPNTSKRIQINIDISSLFHQKSSLEWWRNLSMKLRRNIYINLNPLSVFGLSTFHLFFHSKHTRPHTHTHTHTSCLLPHIYVCVCMCIMRKRERERERERDQIVRAWKCIIRERQGQTDVRLFVRMKGFIRGSLNRFPDFLRMGTFINSTHMKL